MYGTQDDSYQGVIRVIGRLRNKDNVIVVFSFGMLEAASDLRHLNVRDAIVENDGSRHMVELPIFDDSETHCCGRGQAGMRESRNNGV